MQGNILVYMAVNCVLKYHNVITTGKPTYFVWKSESFIKIHTFLIPLNQSIFYSQEKYSVNVIHNTILAHSFLPSEWHSYQLGYTSGKLYSILEYMYIPKVILIILHGINLLHMRTSSHKIKNTEAVDINGTHIPYNITICV
jgi:hypothetical protein